MAIIVRSIAELPAARPIDAKKSRLAMLLFFEVIFCPLFVGMLIIRCATAHPKQRQAPVSTRV
jgi:hypothetical protein